MVTSSAVARDTSSSAAKVSVRVSPRRLFHFFMAPPPL